ncbi:U32 family peptidase [Candidatus Peregrinibacteria bacterium]|jgi:U32 family peptidase|nr:U32 family peptidase [Candidatus Peregrinibacteria bacterium]MBT4631468.1 U32 family peptidase [Candidatus Peregrinibacteria bacterium]MBT5516499.1 U32 family peptidase [Candidatus Peregrinibacteria bacterium]MBT5823857.1 U32 family peptidase [Candidatus Peregrinibacteria bacterium]
MQNGKPEIMAPVGSFASLAAAIKAGCDSVYFGVAQLNMRARSSHNFSLEELKEVADTCNEAGIRSYVTMNTLLYQHDLALMRSIVSTAKEAGISAVIIQDIAAMQYASEIGMPIQASTQLSISNYESVKFYSKFADTIVLARELDLKMMKSICDSIAEDDLRGPSGELIKIEVFVHGALCIAQSGRCQMSLLQNNTSAQRGACLQECRKSYKVIDEETGMEMKIRDSQVLSPKDLCCLPFLDELVATGVSVFKIEGRGRSPQYVDTVVRVYREALDSIIAGEFSEVQKADWMKRLESVFNRGFTDGYYLGKSLPDWSGPSGNKSTEERVFVGIVNHYFPKAGIAELNVQAHRIKRGDKLVIMGKTTGVLYEDVEDIMRDGVEGKLEESEKSDMVTVPVSDRVRRNDKIYLLRKRGLNVL